MYSPQLGRFLSQDPLVASPTVLYDNNWFGDRLTLMRNLYGYVDNNPINATDPSGLLFVPPPPLLTVPVVGQCVAVGTVVGGFTYYCFGRPLGRFIERKCIQKPKKCKLIGSGGCVGKQPKRRKRCTYDCGPDGQVEIHIWCPAETNREPECPGADGSVVEL